MTSPRRTCLALLAALLLAGCAAQRPAPGAPAGDPIQGFNRKMFTFNDTLDVYVLEPVARGWNWAIPHPMQHGVVNFFDNLRFPIVATNQLLQGKVVDSATTTGRFLINTMIGVGFIDPAAEWGLAKKDEDFGQTLAVWGVAPGPYLVLPILGPSTIRETAGLAMDTVFSVTPFFLDAFIIVGPRVVDVVNRRAQVLEDVEEIKRSSFDYYTAVRDGWAQRRESAIHDDVEGDLERQDELYFPEAEPDTEEPK